MINDIMGRYYDGLLAENEAYDLLLGLCNGEEATALDIMDTWDPLD